MVPHTAVVIAIIAMHTTNANNKRINSNQADIIGTISIISAFVLDVSLKVKNQCVIILQYLRECYGKKRMKSSVSDYHKLIQDANQVLHNAKEDERFGVFYLDVIDFKLINNICNFSEGDRFIEAITVFLSSLPTTIVSGRIFSNHFIRLFRYDDIVDFEKEKEEFEQSLLTFIREQQKYHPECSVKIAVGASFIDDKSADVIGAIERANIARKKMVDKNRTGVLVFAQYMYEEIKAKRQLEDDLQSAFDEERFTFFLQPKVDLNNGEIIGAEALVRWLLEDGTLVQPDHFIPFMEENGMILELDFLVYHKVCSYLKHCLEQNKKVVPISMNMSRRHAFNLNTAREIHHIICSYGIPPYLIQFELTESILLEDLSTVAQIINELRSYGYLIAIDDFGAGYSGINMLQELNFDTIKLDKRFVATEDDQVQKSEVVIPRIAEISQDLEVELLCEGVETLEQCRRMRALGCNVAQGFYFSPPVAADVFESMLEKKKNWTALPWKEVKRFSPRHFIRARKKGWGPKKYYPLLLVSLAVLLSVWIGVAFSRYRSKQQEEYDNLFYDNLSAFAESQKLEVDSFNESIITTINAIKYMAEQGIADEESAGFQACLSLVNKKQNSFQVEYYNWNMMEQMESNHSDLFSEDVRQQILRGEDAISDIFYLKQWNGFFYSIMVPIQNNGVTTGVIQSLVDASFLTENRQVLPQAEITNCYLVKSDGKILEVQGKDSPTAQSIYDLVATRKISSNTIRNIENALDRRDDISVFQLENNQNMNSYLSIVPIKDQEWYLANVVEAEEVLGYSNTILKQTVQMIIFMVGLVYLGSGLAIWLYYYQRKQKNRENERYAMLAQFADTVLLQYFYKTDRLEITPNAEKQFCVESCCKENYLRDGKNMLEIHPDDYQAVREVIEHPTPGKRVCSFNIRITSKAGGYVWCSCQYQYVYEKNHPVVMMSKITDISGQMKREERLLEQSYRDGLTEILNKSACERKIKEALNKYRKGSLLMLDVDNFKQINDSHGHATGDQVLIAIGDILKQTFPERNHIVGRIGGDEFVVFIPNSDDLEDVQKRADCLRNKVRDFAQNRNLIASISIGLAITDHVNVDYDTLYRRADEALYRAKSEGKNRSVVFDLDNG